MFLYVKDGWMNRYFKVNYVFNIYLKIYVEYMLNIY